MSFEQGDQMEIEQGEVGGNTNGNAVNQSAHSVGVYIVYTSTQVVSSWDSN